LKPAQQHFGQIDHVGEFLTFSAPPCLDGAKTDQSTRFELSRCLGNKAGLARLVRAPNCRFTSVFESPRPNGRVALACSPPAPHQAKSRTAVETKGQPWQEPVAGSCGANRPRNCQCALPEGGLSLETSSAALWADRPCWGISDVFSSTLPRRRQDRPEHPVRDLSVPWQQSWPGAPHQGAKLPVYLRVRVPTSKWACCACLLSTSAPHQAKSRTAVETKGQPWQEPVAGSCGANRPRNCQCALPEGGLSLETSSAALWADRPCWGISDVFSSTLPRRRQDRPEHPVRALSVPWQQSWPGASGQGAKLPVYLRVRVPTSKWACCACLLSTCPPPGQVENGSRNKRATVAGARRWVLRGQPPPQLSVRAARRRLKP
jgi:hypothetical protein